MKKHLDNILAEIDLLLKSKDYKYNKGDIDKIRSIVISLRNNLEESENILLIDINQVKLLSNMVYDLNYNNSFSKITDYISNELYAFQFLLQESLKERRKNNGER